MRSASMMPTEAHELRYIRLETLLDPKGSWMNSPGRSNRELLEASPKWANGRRFRRGHRKTSMSLTTNRLDPAEQATGVSWGAIAAGAVVAAAFPLALIALGVGLGTLRNFPVVGVGNFGNDVQAWTR
jgi:hypothetical protein